MPVRDDLLEILCCPETKQSLKIAPEELVLKINEKISAGQLTYSSGTQVKDTVDEALVTEDGQRIYAVRDSIPVMLVDECITADQLGDESA